jgi:hypothetical protein
MRETALCAENGKEQSTTGQQEDGGANRLRTRPLATAERQAATW